MADRVDLHLHTNHSDGSDDPAEVVRRAVKCGLSAIAITDHDTLSGSRLARETAAAEGIELLPGVEVSATFANREFHMLGLGVRHDSAPLGEKLESMRAERESRAVRIVERLRALGVEIDADAVQRRVPDGAVGRMHIAAELLERGYVKTVQGAFDKYIKAGRPAYVPKKNLGAREAIDAIHDAGGLAFVAHPGLGDLHKRLDQLLELPFDGIEAIHSRHSPAMTEKLAALAADRGMLITGGSDCHGSAKKEKPLMGTVHVPREVLDAILGRLDRPRPV